MLYASHQKLYIFAHIRYNVPDPVSLGSGQEISIKDLAQVVAKTTGCAGHITWDTARPNGRPRRCLDTTRARERFGLEAKTAFEDGIRKTVGWHEGMDR